MAKLLANRLCKKKWPSTAIFLLDLKGNIHVAHAYASELRLPASLQTAPHAARKGAAQTLFNTHSAVFVKLVWLANMLPCCFLLRPLWFADLWTSVTHGGHENQRLTVVTPTLSTPGDPSFSSPASLLHPRTNRKERRLQPAEEHPQSHSQLLIHHGQ